MPTTNRRRILLIVALVAAAIIVYARLQHRWPYGSTGQRQHEMSPPSKNDVRVADVGYRSEMMSSLDGDDDMDGDDDDVDTPKEWRLSALPDYPLKSALLPDDRVTPSYTSRQRKPRWRRSTLSSAGSGEDYSRSVVVESHDSDKRRLMVEGRFRDVTIIASRSKVEQHSGFRVSPQYKLVRRLHDFNVTSPISHHVVGDDDDDDAWNIVERNDLDRNAEIAFYHAIEQVHATCDDVRRYGNADDGGWNVCVSLPYAPRPGNCIVYSFGINNDFSFDDAVSRELGCQVFAFDPSMSVDDYVRPSGVRFFQLGLGEENTVTESGWKLMTLDSIRRRLRHANVFIDLLKIDIDYSEWNCLPALLSAGTLRNVRQLVLEIHTPEVFGRSTAERQFNRMWSILADVESTGFRRYSVRPNPHGNFNSSRTDRLRTCCYDLGYVNIRFLL